MKNTTKLYIYEHLHMAIQHLESALTKINTKNDDHGNPYEKEATKILASKASLKKVKQNFTK